MLLARAYAIAALEVLPFFLQFLGLGLSETLGEGLCGSALGVSEAEAVRYGLVSEYYFYGQAFLVLLALKATYALGLVLLRFMYPGRTPLRPPGVAARGGALLGPPPPLPPHPHPAPSLPHLPGPGPPRPRPLDPLSLLMAAPEPFLLGLLWRARP